MRRIDISDEQLSWALEILNSNQYDEHEVGNLFKEAWPGVFSDKTSGRSVTYRLKVKLAEAGKSWIPHKGPKVDRPPTRWLDDNPELLIQYHPLLAVVSDIHAGAHDPDVIEFIAEVIKERGIEALVWGGDIFDNAYIGHRGVHDAYASTLHEVIFGAAQCFQRFREAGVTTHYFYQGNHDDKPMRGTHGEWSFSDFLHDKFFPEIDLKGVKVKVTNRYYLTMRPAKPKAWPFRGPQNLPWRFTHQKEYSRIPLRTANRLASKLWMNVACNHQHHLGWSLHESGLVYVADTGCAQMKGAAPYKHRRDSTHPEHINGFLTVEGGQPRAHHFV